MSKFERFECTFIVLPGMKSNFLLSVDKAKAVARHINVNKRSENALTRARPSRWSRLVRFVS